MTSLPDAGYWIYAGGVFVPRGHPNHGRCPRCTALIDRCFDCERVLAERSRALTAEHQLREARTQVERVEREATENREAAITERSLRRQAEKDANETWGELERCQEALRDFHSVGERLLTMIINGRLCQEDECCKYCEPIWNELRRLLDTPVSQPIEPNTPETT